MHNTEYIFPVGNEALKQLKHSMPYQRNVAKQREYSRLPEISLGSNKGEAVLLLDTFHTPKKIFIAGRISQPSQRFEYYQNSPSKVGYQAFGANLSQRKPLINHWGLISFEKPSITAKCDTEDYSQLFRRIPPIPWVRVQDKEDELRAASTETLFSRFHSLREIASTRTLNSRENDEYVAVERELDRREFDEEAPRAALARIEKDIDKLNIISEIEKLLNKLSE